MAVEQSFLKLGIVDGGLKRSPAVETWQFAMRMRGMAACCLNAGVPVDADDLATWVSTYALPPRQSEGINDDISVPTIAFVADRIWSSVEGRSNPAKTSQLDSFVDYRAMAFEYSIEDALFYSALIPQRIWAEQRLMDLSDVSQVCFEIMKWLRIRAGEQRLASSTPILGEGRVRPIVWVAAAVVPTLLQKSRLTSYLHSNLVPTLRDETVDANGIERAILKCIEREAAASEKSLRRLEGQIEKILDRKRTARSRSEKAAKLICAMPEINTNKLAMALGSTPQGAGYIRRELTSSGAF